MPSLRWRITSVALPVSLASSFTSDATPAKPLPASPARAASTAAFSASRLVWKAISSMTRMILEISSEECLIASIACDIFDISSEPTFAAFWPSAASLAA